MCKNGVLLINIFVAIYFVGCDNYSAPYYPDDYKTININIDDYDISKQIDYEIVEINEEIINPDFLHIEDSLLIVVENDVSDEIFKVFSLTDLSLLNTFGVRGSGPAEYSDFLHNIVQVQDVDNNSISTFDWQKKRLSRLELNDILTDKFIDTEKNYLLPPELMLAQRAVFISDSTVVGIGGIDKGTLFIIDTNTDQVQYIPHLPIIKDELSNQQYNQLYTGEFVVNKNKGLIASVYSWFPQLIIHDLSGEIKSITYFDEIANPFSYSEPDRILFNSDIVSTNNYIYVVHIGKSIETLNNIRGGLNNADTYVHVYDWSGNLIKVLYLTNKLLFNIVIDEINNRIIGIDLLSEEHDIIQYQDKSFK